MITKKTKLKRKKRYSSNGKLFNYKEKKCIECGEIFKPNTNVAKYCSLTCQNRNRRRRRADWIRDYNNKYRKKNPLKIKEWKKDSSNQWRKKNHKKYVAQYKARSKVPLKSFCEICGLDKNLERHHWNYDKPLLVNTLCKQCHRIQHVKNFNNSSFGRER